eukprot:jgi/Ulvmu1/10383/UM061_0067.1
MQLMMAAALVIGTLPIVLVWFVDLKKLCGDAAQHAQQGADAAQHGADAAQHAQQGADAAEQAADAAQQALLPKTGPPSQVHAWADWRRHPGVGGGDGQLGGDCGGWCLCADGADDPGLLMWELRPERGRRRARH